MHCVVARDVLHKTLCIYVPKISVLVTPSPVSAPQGLAVERLNVKVRGESVSLPRERFEELGAFDIPEDIVSCVRAVSDERVSLLDASHDLMTGLAVAIDPGPSYWRCVSEQGYEVPHDERRAAEHLISLFREWGLT